MNEIDSDWFSSTDEVMIPHREVHVWRANLDHQVNHLPEWAALLSADEQERAERFYFEQHRQRFIVARGILRWILSRYLQRDPKHLQFSYGPYGKPELVEIYNPSLLKFNLAHSQSLAVYAVSCDRTVGIDLEYLRPMEQVEQLANRFFSASEYADICAHPPMQRQRAFFRYWTCKESYLKATGEGLAQLGEVEIQFQDGCPRLIKTSDRSSPADWRLLELYPEENYLAAIAVAGIDWTLKRWQL